MSQGTAQRAYSIKEVAALTYLPASIPRYYESIGVIAPIGRGANSKHCEEDEVDLDQLMSTACLSATGLSVNDMRALSRRPSEEPRLPPNRSGCCPASRTSSPRTRHVSRCARRHVGLKIETSDKGDS